MTLADLAKKSAANNEINWVTATFMMLFHIGAVAALFFFTLEGVFPRAISCAGCRAASESAWAITGC